MNYTGGDINRLGDRIRNNPGHTIEDEDLDLLQAHRLSFTNPLFKIFQELTETKSKVQRTAIIAFRLKRISTIINKVIRKPEMQLNRMWDIAGIRIIFDNEQQVRRVLNIIIENYEIRGVVRDYFENPKDIGYKAIHIYITDPKSKKVIEVQLRTNDSHNWATLVEITDVLYHTRLKENGYDSNPEWGKFHSLVSSEKELSREEANFLYKVLNRKDFISKLAHIFRENSHVVKKQWQNVMHKDKFFLLELSNDSSPILTSYKEYNKAEKDYFQKYKNDESALIVLTSINKPTFELISMAYANYLLTYHKFIEDVQEIIKTLALDKLESNEYKSFRKIFRLYENIQANHIINLLVERDDLTIRIQGNKLFLKSANHLSSKKRKEIINQFKVGLKKLGVKHKKFILEIEKEIHDKPSYFWMTRIFLKKHSKRINKKLKSMNITFQE